MLPNANAIDLLLYLSESIFVSDQVCTLIYTQRKESTAIQIYVWQSLVKCDNLIKLELITDACHLFVKLILYSV